MGTVVGALDGDNDIGRVGVAVGLTDGERVAVDEGEALATVGIEVGEAEFGEAVPEPF